MAQLIQEQGFGQALSGGLNTELVRKVCVILLDLVPISDREVFSPHPGEGEVSS